MPLGTSAAQFELDAAPPARAARRFRLALVHLAAMPALAAAPPNPLSELDAYPYAIGTQIFRPQYQFTKETALVETAVACLDMGSNTIKFGMGKTLWGNVPALGPEIRSLADLAGKEPSHKRVLDMPFAHYLIWAYPFSTNEGNFSGRIAQDVLDREYRELRAFATYLLRTYAGTGKSFYLGHWEGDWLLLGHYDAKRDPAPERIANMIQWLNVRQKAVDDARRAVPHQGVRLYHYTEVNLVQKAIAGAACVTNSVLPRTQVDYVSYSSYDSLGEGQREKLLAALKHIDSRLPPKDGLAGKRVFIGEYGFPAERHAPPEQDRLSREVMKAGLEWGCPFVLYWEMYNNEVADGKHRGFWLIDDKGEKQPVYYTHQGFLRGARRAVADFRRREKRLPTPQEYWKQVGGLLDEAPGNEKGKPS